MLKYGDRHKQALLHYCGPTLACYRQKLGSPAVTRRRAKICIKPTLTVQWAALEANCRAESGFTHTVHWHMQVKHTKHALEDGTCRTAVISAHDATYVRAASQSRLETLAANN